MQFITKDLVEALLHNVVIKYFVRIELFTDHFRMFLES